MTQIDPTYIRKKKRKGSKLSTDLQENNSNIYEKNGVIFNLKLYSYLNFFFKLILI